MSWLRLIRSRRVGAATALRLISEHGSAAAAVAALPKIARASGLADYAPCPLSEARAELDAGLRLGARLIVFADAAYPERLRDLPDAPPVLWALGDTALAARPMVAVVGARNASSVGVRMARRLAEGLGQAGLAVVSGLARGIDAAAHAASLGTGTLAVQAGGIDCIYPPENAELAGAIAAQGLRLAELAPGTQPQARHFPMRNRIVWGMALGVVVVEAASGSGSLITARGALDLGREVMAVPGHPVDARAAGCNQLIREGATLVRDAADVLAALGLADGALGGGRPAPAAVGRAPDGAAVVGHSRLQPRGAGAPTAPSATATTHVPRPGSGQMDPASALLARLGPTAQPQDDLIRELIRDLGLPPGTLNAALAALELDGRIERVPGGLIRQLV